MTSEAPPPERAYSRISVPLITATIVALCGLLYWQTGQLRDRQYWIERSYEVKLEIEELDRTLREAESVQRAILLTGRGATGLEVNFPAYLESVRTHFFRLRALVVDNPAQMGLVNGLFPVLEKRLIVLERNSLELRNLGESERSARILDGVVMSKAVESQLHKLRISEERLLSQRSEKAKAMSRRLLVLATGGSMLGLAVMLVAFLQQRRNAELRARYLDRLADARDTALDSVRATSIFVASVSHEIRTPMNGVLGAADLLRQDRRLDRRQRELVETIHYSGEALLDLINDILDLSKLQAGKMNFSNEEFPLAEVLEESLALFADAAGRKQLELAHRIDSKVPTRLKGDPLRLRQVLVNLVGNAVKFTDQGSVLVEVSLRGGEPGRPVLRFRVTDTGPGIAPEEQERLFLAFSQVNAALSRRHSGTGLGLAISMEIAQRMGGTIGVESVPGKGSTFWFTARLEEASEQTGGREHLCNGGTLLLLEDRDLTAGTIGQHVHAWGMKVVVVKDLEGLINLRLSEETAAIVIGRVGEVSWQVAVEQIDARRDLRNAPKFLLSQPQSQPNDQEMARAGIRACLRFPFRPSDLYNLLAHDHHEPELLAEEAALPAARVLLVEDNLINQRVFGRQLEMLGVEMLVRGDGHEGLEARIAGGIDLILMDCQLPTVDGFEATRRIREWELKTGASRIPIIAVTAHVMSGDAEACFQAGMDDYLPKPFDLVKLRRKLGRWLLPAGGGALPEPVRSAVPITRILDTEQLGECLTGIGEVDGDLITLALEETAARCEDMKNALRTGDGPAWKAAAHRGVGTAATMGFAELAELLRKAETGDEDEVRSAAFVGRIEASLASTRQSLSAIGFVSRTGSGPGD